MGDELSESDENDLVKDIQMKLKDPYLLDLKDKK